MKSTFLATAAAGAPFVAVACTGMTSRLEPTQGDDTNSALEVPARAGGQESTTADAAGFETRRECGAFPAGLEPWRRGLGEMDVSQWTSLAVDPENNPVASSEPGGTVKLDPLGRVKWTKAFGALVATGPDGHIHVAGTFKKTATPEGCSVTAATTETDAYVAEVDTDGTTLRCSSLGGATDAGLAGLSVDRNGDSIVSGPGLGTVKLDDTGHIVWRQALAGRVATDSHDNVLVAGALSGSAAFGEDTIESAGGDDALVAKLSPEGDFLFVLRFGDAGPDQRSEGVAVDPSDNILLSGVADGTIDFGDGPITTNPEDCPSETWCAQSGFVAKFDPMGNVLWSRSRFPVRSLPGIAADSHGNVIASGAYPGNAPPYRLPLLVEFDSAGNSVARMIPRISDVTDSGAGYGVSFDRCDNVLWAHAAPPVPATRLPSFLEKLAP
jgi:hypothetical protein